MVGTINPLAGVCDDCRLDMDIVPTHTARLVRLDDISSRISNKPA